MSESHPVTIARRGKVFEVTIDRPPVNAINQAVANALYGAFCTLRDDPELIVGILTGSGERCFSAGWDLKNVAGLAETVEAPEQAGMTPGGFAGVTEMWDLSKPVIAAVNGAAVGAGFQIVLACDLVMAAEHAMFWVPDIALGFLPDADAIQRLPRRIPYNVAMELLYTGRHLSAEEARHWGLVHEVTPAARLLERTRELAATIAEGAPLALQALKEVVSAISELPLPEAFARTKRGKSNLPIYEKMLASEDYREGPRAFAEKRKPIWKGR